MQKILDGNVLPIFYELDLDVKETEFSGVVQIDCHPRHDVLDFYMNSKGLVIKRVVYEGKEIGFDLNADNELLKIMLPKKVSSDFLVKIEYEGSYSEGMFGFYKTTYKDKLLFSTYFELMNARKAFPCFDQPDMKAKFQISITVPEDGYIALSNMKGVKVADRRYVFKTTPKMSTYLVAFVIGKLQYIEMESRKVGNGKNIPIRVYGHAEEVEYGQFALEIAVRALEFYEKYFDVGYALDKLDMVAIPLFSMGAMEHWGLVTYRSSNILCGSRKSSIRSKKNIAITVAHDLAHMWFGNLVTMKRWNELWLNEGFGMWAATLSLHENAQDMLSMDFWMDFLNRVTDPAMYQDSLPSTHEVEEAEKGLDINRIILLSKASSIINMVENWLGAEVFRKGLSNYFKKYAYSNTIKDNLWDALSEASKVSSSQYKDVKRLVSLWITQKGFPWIDVAEDGESLVIRQQRFTFGFFDDDQTWPIPIKIFWGNRQVSEFTMEDREMRVPLVDKLYKINSSGSGFYRVKYSDKAFMRIVSSDLSVVNKMKIFNDSFELAFNNIGIFPFDHMNIFMNENNYEVMLLVLSNLINIQQIFYDFPEKEEFLRTLALGLVEKKISHIDLSIKNNQFKTANDISLASLIVRTAVELKHLPTLKKFKMLVGEDGKLNLNAVNKEYILHYLISNADSHFDQIFEIAMENSFNALFALGCVSDESNLYKIFNDFEKISRRNVIHIFKAFSSNNYMRHSIMELFIKNYDRIKKHISDYNLLSDCIEDFFSNVLSDGYVDIAMNFLKSLEHDQNLSIALKNTLDTIKYKTKLRSSYANKSFK